MYIPKNLRMSASHVNEFIAEFAFAILISEDLQTTHLPLYMEGGEGGGASLYGHMAKANPHWKSLEGKNVKAIFHGPHSYVSPSWYADSPAVPTWNYAAVHVCGIASLLNEEQTFKVIQNLVTQYEPALLNNNEIMPLHYQQKLAKAIVGFKIDISQIEGKQKLGQHRSLGDQQGVTHGLERSAHTDAHSLLAYKRKTGIGLG